jgi:hypothetical protein
MNIFIKNIYFIDESSLIIFDFSFEMGLVQLIINLNYLFIYYNYTIIIPIYRFLCHVFIMMSYF